MVENAEEIIANNTPESVAAATGSDGMLYAYPATADNGYFMFYNKEYFTEEDVQTLDAMLAKAAEAGKYVGFPMSNGWYFYSWFKGAGLEMKVNEDGVTNSCNWNATDTPITGVQVLEALLEIAANPGFKEADSDPFVAGVKDGSIIAGVSGTWNANVAAETWGDNYAATQAAYLHRGGPAGADGVLLRLQAGGREPLLRQPGRRHGLRHLHDQRGEPGAAALKCSRQGPSNVRPWRPTA